MVFNRLIAILYIGIWIRQAVLYRLGGEEMRVSLTRAVRWRGPYCERNLVFINIRDYFSSRGDRSSAKSDGALDSRPASSRSASKGPTPTGRATDHGIDNFQQLRELEHTLGVLLTLLWNRHHFS